MRRAHKVSIDAPMRCAYSPRVLISFARGQFVVRLGRRVVDRFDSLRAAMDASPEASIDGRAEQAAKALARESRCSAIGETRYAVVS